MPVLLLLFTVVLLIALLIPVSLVQRYRVGRARRRARRWVASLNVVMLCVSVAAFLAGAAVTAVWVPNAFLSAAGGLLAGAALGAVGLALTRWEVGADAIHYTPNRWLVLGLTLLVTTRLLYGFWRGWQVWRVTPDAASWLAAAGAAGSLTVGGVVLGYYVTYWAGVRRRVARRAG